MVQQDIRWIQRFSNYRKALAKLSQAMAIMSEQLAFNDGVDELLQEGMIQRFEYTHELAWKVMSIRGIPTSAAPVMPYAKPLKWD